MRMMIFGAGYSGKAIAAACAPVADRVSGTTRSAERTGTLAEAGITPFVFDGKTLSDVVLQEMAGTTHLVQSIAPGLDGDPLLRLSDNGLGSLMPELQWVTYLSTVGVYGNYEGAWVDEATPCKPVSDRSVERVDAEKAWLALGETLDIPVAVLRLSGIYGPGRNAFRNLANGTARRLIKPGQVFNRIRVEDIGGATAFLSARGLGGIFNITDDMPCPPQDVVSEAAALMGIEPPPEQDFDTAEISPMARSFYGESKRVSNAAIRNLGFDFAFPDYRMSLAQLWSSDSWRG